MIDWLSIILPVKTKISGGRILKICPDGEIESEQVKPLQIKGSFDDACYITNIQAERSMRGHPVVPGQEMNTAVYLSGNPSKWLQGHNIFGTNDLKGLVFKWISEVTRLINVDLDERIEWMEKAFNGEYEITRIDINESFHVEGNNNDVSRWIYAAHRTARVSHKSASMSGGDTLYFGKNSRRHSIKIYNKFKELIKHPVDKKLKDSTFDYEKRIMQDAENLLRVEVTFRGRKLREMGLDMGKYYDMDVIRNMYHESIKGIHISEQLPNYKLTRDIVGRAAYCSYLAWLGGEDLKSVLKKTQFYEHRNKLLPYGIDLLVSRDLDESHKNNVIPLIKVIEAKPVQIPEWYYQKGLIAA